MGNKAMQATTLQKAIQEAKRFIKLAEEVPMKENNPVPGVRKFRFIEPGKASGAAKRASMDLSRCLSDLRLGR
jgi:hypothetical protein